MRHRSTRRVLAAAAAVLLAAAATQAVASVFLKVDIPTLKRMSEAVVHARVSDVRSEWGPDGRFIFTYATLDVKGRLHGQAADQVIVRVPGGQMGDYHVEMIGAPTFQVGDEVVVFLSRWGDGAPMVAGYAEGVSRVVTDAVGNRILKGGLADGMPMSDLARQLGRAAN